ncbi:MAG: PEP-CTERM sorting domain-containing protein [Acidobacteriia bacterium]|nr:PEP-CTERM sorting domain-containing protein [Terriglobia bacterium]
MKRILFLSLFVLLPLIVSAAIVPQCSQFGTGTATDIQIAGSVWQATNADGVGTFACEQQDKIYSNFFVLGMSVDTSLRLQVQALAAGDFHTVAFNGNFTGNFLVSYDIAVDLAISPDFTISRVSGDLSNPSGVGTPSNLKEVFDAGGNFIGSLTSTPGNPGTPFFTGGVTSLQVFDSYTAGGGAAVSVANTFLETTPEPVTMVLLGTGLLGIGALGRRRKK